MSISVVASASDQSVKVIINERFDFSLHQQFREAYIGRDNKGTEFIVDLSNTTYMDSSALGMILLLKDHADKLSGSIKILKPNEAINKILDIAQFHRLMTIDS